MYRLLAMDLDETLLSSDKHVSPKNREALCLARQNGIHTVIATGRPYFSFRHTLEEIGMLDLAGEYSISLNGGAIVENSTGKTVLLDGLPYSVIEKLFARALEYDVFIHVYTDDEVYAWNLNDDERQFLKGRLDVIELEKPDLSALADRTFVKILYGNTDMDVLRSIEAELHDDLSDLDVSFSSSRYLEFNRKGVSKGTGLAHLADLMNLSVEQTAAIGDHLNDLSMLETAGHSMAVANAVDEVKGVCSFITEADHNHDAIAQAVEHLLALNEQSIAQNKNEA